jgi:pyruvate formate lyase activating enzyme
MPRRHRHAERRLTSGSVFVRQALLQRREGGRVQCLTCERRCSPADGQRGWCRTRENRAGTLFTLTYGAVSSLSCNPIEKKPLYHFYPGSLALTAGSWSCNFACPWCQNFSISKRLPPLAAFRSPAEFVSRARRLGCRGTSISFNEPTLSLEWSLEVFRLARETGLYNTFVTNGSMTDRALELLVSSGLDGMNVDIKGDSEAVRRWCRFDPEVVWRNCRRAREMGVWLEVTTLVVPGVNDGPGCLQGIAARIADELGAETPWHVSRYFPSYRFAAAPTSLATLLRARDHGWRAGLRYVYLGNLFTGLGEETVCPGCGACLVRRMDLRLAGCTVRADGRCPHCQELIAGVGWDWPARESEG